MFAMFATSVKWYIIKNFVAKCYTPNLDLCVGMLDTLPLKKKKATKVLLIKSYQNTFYQLALGVLYKVC